jgi:hypothetical protein
MSFEPGRRRTLQGLVALAALCSAPRLVTGRAKAARPRSVVARARRCGVVDASTGAVDVGKLDDLLGAAIARTTGDATPVAALRRLFRATDVVGIKISTLGGPHLSPHPGLVLRLAGLLGQAGVPEHNIVIWDRTDDELTRAGFTLNRSGAGVRCLGTNQDYDWNVREWGAGGSCFAELLLSELTALISVGVLKDHDLAGVSAGMKNWYGVIHNPNKLHDHGCDPYVARLAAYPTIRKKLRLTLIDGLVAQCQGGPAYSPRWTWPWGGVLASTDPVAIDATAWRAIEARRRELGLKSLAEEGREPKWIATAARLGLGQSRASRIQVVDV